MYVCMHELCVYVRRIFHSVKREKKTTATVCGVWGTKIKNVWNSKTTTTTTSREQHHSQQQQQQHYE